MSDPFKYWPAPWRFEEEGYNEGPSIKDARGNVICALFWPVHQHDETVEAVGALHSVAHSIVQIEAQSVATHRHIKRGAVYRLAGISTLQSSGGPIGEGTKIAHYIGEGGDSWSRPQAEFDDGRFEELREPLFKFIPARTPMEESAISKIREDLEWRGPNNRKSGHVVLSREQAASLIGYTEHD